MDKKELLTCLLCNTRRYIKEHPNSNISRYEVFLMEAVLHEQVPETYDEHIFPKVIEAISKDVSMFPIFFSITLTKKVHLRL